MHDITLRWVSSCKGTKSPLEGRADPFILFEAETCPPREEVVMDVTTYLMTAIVGDSEDLALGSYGTFLHFSKFMSLTTAFNPCLSLAIHVYSKPRVLSSPIGASFIDNCPTLFVEGISLLEQCTSETPERRTSFECTPIMSSRAKLCSLSFSIECEKWVRIGAPT